jgi:hypothetical protein
LRAPTGRLRFATTQAFLQRFGLASLQELTAASFFWRIVERKISFMSNGA